MNQPRRPGAPSAAPEDGFRDGEQTKKGSIKAARERLQAMMEGGEGFRREPPPGFPPSRPVPSAQPSRGPFQGQAAIPNSPGSPQWPLSNNPKPESPMGSPQRSQAPQRPPRPSYVPSILDPTKPRDVYGYADDELPLQIPTSPPRIGPKSPQRQLPLRQVPRASAQTASTAEPLRAYWEDDFSSPTSSSYLSPNPSRPVTTSSQSTSSSLGSIPDFPQAPAVPPVPQQPPPSQPPPRRSPALGPPPSARRGPTSYYSQTSYVSPIVEESETKSRSSYASSTAMPSSAAQDFYLDEGSESQSDVDGPFGDERRRIGNAEGQPVLVRQASLGKRGRPALTTIKSGDDLRNDARNDRDLLPSQRSPDATPKQSRFPKPRAAEYSTAATLGAAAGSLEAPTRVGAPGSGATTPRRDGQSSVSPMSDPLSTGTGYLEGSSDEEQGNPLERELATRGSGRPDSSTEPNWGNEKIPVDIRSSVVNLDELRSPQKSPVSPVDPRIQRILGGLEMGGALDPETREKLASPKPQGNLGDRVGARRPPRLNVDAVKEAETRGSLSSLPELIRRATRLASNLERGKTASRLGMDFWELGNANKGRGTPPSGERNRRSGSSLTDMLSAFPPPGLATPPLGSARSPNNPFRSPSNLNISQTMGDNEETPSQQKRRRRCCGMPLWVFILIMIALVLLIAAAIIVPIALIVLPKKDNSAPAGSIQACQQQLTCQNGGTNVISAGACRCLCVNGFTGSTCQNQTSDPGCVSSDVNGAASNATIGSAIPRLIQDAQNNFSVPLNAQQILPLFTAADFSCSSENALVTFNGLFQRSLDVNAEQEAFHEKLISELPSTTAFSIQTAPPSLHARQVYTSDGIALEGGTPGGSPGGTPTSTLDISVSPSSTTAPSAQPDTTSSATSSSPSASGSSAPSESRQMDFARVAVLFILQNTTQLDSATTASDNLASFFNGNSEQQSQAQNNVSLGSGFSADLSKGVVILPDGIRIGGKL
ncbi:MAG: hypothetical protein M1820_003685 [Bogoriella megaspora]|nr:MAG: hypothetical protein M1820_003685 [Bogoriella megaspora]